MKKIVLAVLISFVSLAVQAAIVNVPPKAGIAPRANAPGSGYSPPSRTQKPPAKPAPAAAQPSKSKPAYIENGRPVYNNAPPAAKICKDNQGNVINCIATNSTGNKFPIAKPVSR